ncbi:trypco2 family protein [Pseudofrankia inefficax]|uniref:trypco2 family protein n=1 Tax=Pseudofrankia inefficax (strain DSM 45817 / CECT 9037 / DDB 130130 / EuI1c) TaxID=298654 RepID=UPI0002F2D073|nr:trypco2 family protein [Pseudofrankia inefficax]
MADAIGSLRRELAAARLAADGESIRFELGDVELEFGLELRKEGKGELGAKFWVVSVGGGGSRGSTATHRLKLKLKPHEVVADGSGGTVRRTVDISDEDDD